jgi:hypothetical protein
VPLNGTFDSTISLFLETDFANPKPKVCAFPTETGDPKDPNEIFSGFSFSSSSGERDLPRSQ